jgi:hypothetical protein
VKRIELTGQKFGKLTVTGYAGAGRWDVKCDCGMEKTVSGLHLRAGDTKSCGCASPAHRVRPVESRKKQSATAIQAHFASSINYVGHTFGPMTVVARSTGRKHRGETRSETLWVARCQCGREREFTITGLGMFRSGKQKGCGPGCPVSSLQLPAGEAGLSLLVKQYRQGAQVRGHHWGLTRESARALFVQPCSYCGAPPAQEQKTSTPNGTFVYNGIDRIDNTLGYVEGNVVPCCGTCNKAKSTMPVDSFLAYLEALVDYRLALRSKRMKEAV